MGNRVLALLYTDEAHEWENDPELGKKIMRAMHYTHDERKSDLGYGRVVQSCHADTQTLAIIDGYSFTEVVQKHWYQNQPADELTLEMLKMAAEKFGYRLHKRSAK